MRHREKPLPDSPLDSPAANTDGSRLPDYSTAVHEPGHAVVARLLGCEVEQAAIIETANYRGICWTIVKTRPVEIYAIREAAVSCAGGEAKRLIFRSTSDEANRSDEHDFAEAFGLLPHELRLDSGFARWPHGSCAGISQQLCSLPPILVLMALPRVMTLII